MAVVDEIYLKEMLASIKQQMDYVANMLMPDYENIEKFDHLGSENSKNGVR